MRTDCGMPAGKMVAQAGHAMQDMADACRDRLSYKIWNTDYGQKKVALAVNLEEMLRIVNEAQEFYQLPAGIVIDEGKTVFNGVETITCGWIGPAEEELMDYLTGHLELL